jgi:hypothetical protein
MKLSVIKLTSQTLLNMQNGQTSSLSLSPEIQFAEDRTCILNNTRIHYSQEITGRYFLNP